MHRAVGWLSVLAALFLAGCGPIYETTYELTPPVTAEGRLCATQCQTTQQYCRRNCALEAEECRYRARDDARRDYDRYVREQRERGKRVERGESSFENTYRCSETSCKDECGGDFRMCYSTCGGRVVPHRVCTAFCDEEPTIPAASSRAASPLCRPNARVKVLSDGEWYPARVNGAILADGRCPIHYEGYGSGDDEAVSSDRLSK